jgi:hypothetical protein
MVTETCCASGYPGSNFVYKSISPTFVEIPSSSADPLHFALVSKATLSAPSQWWHVIHLRQIRSQLRALCLQLVATNLLQQFSDHRQQWIHAISAARTSNETFLMRLSVCGIRKPLSTQTRQLQSGWIASNLNYPTSSLQAAVRFERIKGLNESLGLVVHGGMMADNNPESTAKRGRGRPRGSGT